MHMYTRHAYTRNYTDMREHVHTTQLVVERGKAFMCGTNWNLDMIEVFDVSRGHTYKWACGKWFNDKDGLKKEWSRDKMGQQEQDLELVEAPAGL